MRKACERDKDFRDLCMIFLVIKLVTCMNIIMNVEVSYASQNLFFFPKVLLNKVSWQENYKTKTPKQHSFLTKYPFWFMRLHVLVSMFSFENAVADTEWKFKRWLVLFIWGRDYQKDLISLTKLGGWVLVIKTSFNQCDLWVLLSHIFIVAVNCGIV